ncbi:hypothetical protein KA119_00765 [Candidatus Gracilibacteria bacterium]|nr:hypothetical protein [Candidatus Gracilibacteria bacterium]
MKKFLALALISVMGLSGCNFMKSEKELYMAAVKEATCMLFEAEDMFDPALEEATKEIFRDKGFDADDEQAMVALAEKYDGDPDVQAAIEEALDECAGDMSEMMESLGDINLEEELEETEVEGEEAVVEEGEVEAETLDEASDDVPAAE